MIRTAHRRTALLLSLVAAAALAVSVPVALAVSDAPSNWMPRHGSSTIRKDSNNNRFIQQEFKWDSSGQMDRLTEHTDGALEVETHFNCYDSTCYLGDACGTISMWDTDLPRGYKDWPSGDNCDQPHPTVGAGKTYHNLTAGHNYIVFIRPTYGSNMSNSDTATVKFQLMDRDPDYCYDWICFNSIATQSAFSSWAQAVPGTKTWNWSP